MKERALLQVGMAAPDLPPVISAPAGCSSCLVTPQQPKAVHSQMHSCCGTSRSACFFCSVDRRLMEELCI